MLPAMFFGLMLFCFGAGGAWRVAFIKAAIATGLVVVANTEVLSLFGALAMPWEAAAWTLACCLAAVGVWQRRADLAERMHLLSGSRPSFPVVFAVVPVGMIAIATGVIAWVAPPNNWDSMVYHVARVAHWAADATVAHYPTNIAQQLYLPPWSEFAVLQLQVLSGDDHFANLVQWFSMVGSIVGASLIAQQLGSTTRGQVLAAIVVATLPMGILQASSTQTDYTLAFWLVCSVSLALSFVARRMRSDAAWFAASLGLAMLTKGTAYLFAVPVAVFLGFWMVAKLKSRLLVPGLLMVFIPLVINAGYYIRNEAVFHNPLAPSVERTLQTNTSYTPKVVLSNAIRDAVLQFGTPNANFNQWLDFQVTRVHRAVLHIGLNDPGTTWPGVGFQVNALSFHEDTAGDPLQALLAIGAVLAGIGFGFRRGPPLVLAYSCGLVLASLLFAAYLKWQPWHSRLELPLLVLSAPLIGAVVARRLNLLVASVLGAVLLVAAVPWVIDNDTRPMVGFTLPSTIDLQPRLVPVGQTIFNMPRTDLYFVGRPPLESAYALAVARAGQTGCKDIGLWSGIDDWEYPLWVLANQSGNKLRIDQVFVTNESITATRFGTKPCLIVALTADQPATVVLDGAEFTLSLSQDGVGLYTPSPGG